MRRTMYMGIIVTSKWLQTDRENIDDQQKVLSLLVRQVRGARDASINS